MAGFSYAFDWLGFGAKTAVGYGQMAAPREQAKSPEISKGASATQANAVVGKAAEHEVWDKAYLTVDLSRMTLIASYKGKKAEKKEDPTTLRELKDKLHKKKSHFKVVAEHMGGKSYKIISYEL